MQELAKQILKYRQSRKLTQFALFANIVSWAVLYLTLVSAALMPDDLMNPAFARFIASEEFSQIVRPRFDALASYNEDPARHPRPNANLLATDSSQFGVVVQVEYLLVPQTEAAPDGITRYRYNINVRVRPSLPVLAVFAGVELVWIYLLAWGLRGRRDPVHAEFESAVLRGYYFPEATDTANTPAAHEALLRLLDRFHVYANELQALPRAGHSTWKITDEHDVQHALCALLRTHFDNVKPEETTPSLVGSSSRVDFLLVNERIVVETKMTRNSLTERKLGEQLLLDVAHYSSHPQCESLVFLIYDPTYLIRNPVGLRDEVVEAARGFPVEVVYSPPR